MERANTSVLSLLGLVILCAACNRVPPVEEYPGLAGTLLQDSIDKKGLLIAVASIEGCYAIGPPHTSRWDGNSPMQLFKLKLLIENSLQGELQTGEADVFFYLNLRVSTGPARLGVNGCGGYGGDWRIGDRKMFLLLRDGGLLRTVCDTFNTCVRPILTGKHPDLEPTASRPVDQVIVDFFLTRGAGCCTDQQLLDVIEQSGPAFLVSRNYAVHKMQDLAEHETGLVRERACMVLANYEHPCIRGLPDDKSTNHPGKQ